MRNAGGSSLSEVTAHDKAGRTRAGPLTLAAGATEECTWTQEVESDFEECVTVGGNGSDGRLATVQARGRVEVEGGGVGGGGLPSWLVPAGVAAALVGLAIVPPAGPRRGRRGGRWRGRWRAQSHAFQVFSSCEVFDLDARGDDVVFAGPATGEDSVIRRLNPLDQP